MRYVEYPIASSQWKKRYATYATYAWNTTPRIMVGQDGNYKYIGRFMIPVPTCNEPLSHLIIGIPLVTGSSSYPGGKTATSGGCIAKLSTVDLDPDEVVNSTDLEETEYIGYEDLECTSPLKAATDYKGSTIYYKIDLTGKPSNTTYYVYFMPRNANTDSDNTEYANNTIKGSSNGSADTVIVYARNEFTISYNTAGNAVAPTSQIKTFNVPLTLSGAISRESDIKTVTTTFKGMYGTPDITYITSSAALPYTFTGWKASDGTLYAAGESYIKNEDTVMTAQWVAGSYVGSPITFPDVLRNGYTLQGWYTQSIGGVKKESYSPTEDSILYAHWNPNTYIIKYDGNGSTSGTTADSSHTYDTSIQLTSNGFVKTGYTFIGWKDSNGNEYADQQSVMNLTATDGATITLYAQWDRTSLLRIKDNNTYKASTIRIKTDGEWKQATAIYMKVNGQWKSSIG